MNLYQINNDCFLILFTTKTSLILLNFNNKIFQSRLKNIKYFNFEYQVFEQIKIKIEFKIYIFVVNVDKHVFNRKVFVFVNKWKKFNNDTR